MIRLGAFWEMTANHPDQLPQRDWFDKRFSGCTVHDTKRILWNSDHPVAWIGETGRHITNIAERVLIGRWDHVSTQDVKESKHV